jgi:hypothetical protein
MTTATETETPKVWIGCLACYNGGTLRGEWVEGIEASDFVPCKDFSHEEFWVMDHENYLGALKGECSPHEAQKIAEELTFVIELAEDHFGIPAPVLIERAQDIGVALADIEQEEMEFEGCHDSDEAFAEEVANEVTDIDLRRVVWPYTCIDWDQASRDLMMDYSVIIFDGSRYYFRD